MNIFWWIFIVIIILIIIAFAIKVILMTSAVEKPMKNRSLEITKTFDLEPKENKFISYNPSITEYCGDKYLIIYRIYLSSTLTTRRYMLGITMLNKLLEIEGNSTFIDIPNEQIFINGYIDPKVFIHDDIVYCLALVYCTGNTKVVFMPRMHLLRFDIPRKTIEEDRIIYPYHEEIDSIQKNWNYLDLGEDNESNPIFVTRINPLTIVSIDLKTAIPTTLYSTRCEEIEQLKNNNPDKKINGGTKAIKINNKYVAIAHTKIVKDGNMDLEYSNFFYEFSSKPPFSITRFSNEFSIPTNRFKNGLSEKIQMITGLEHHNDTQVIITFGINDRMMMGVLCSKETIEKMLDENSVRREEGL